MTITLTEAPALITEPGAYRMPISRYHEQCCDAPSISSSGLRKIYRGSPAHFWVQSDLNPSREVEPPSHALSFGRAAHCLLLGDEVFDEGFVVLPTDAPTYPSTASWAAKQSSEHVQEAKDWWLDWQVMAAGRTSISAEDHDHICGMAESLQQHPIIADIGLFSGVAEPSLIWRHRGVWIKSRPDMLPESGTDIADLKTTASIDWSFCTRQIRDKGYDMQMALAAEGAKRLLGLTITDAVLMFIEKEPPYATRAIPISDETMHFARRANAVAAEQFARAVESGVWPGPVDEMRAYEMSSWAQEDVGRREADLAMEAADG